MLLVVRRRVRLKRKKKNKKQKTGWLSLRWLYSQLARPFIAHQPRAVVDQQPADRPPADDEVVVPARQELCDLHRRRLSRVGLVVRRGDVAGQERQLLSATPGGDMKGTCKCVLSARRCGRSRAPVEVLPPHRRQAESHLPGGPLSKQHEAKQRHHCEHGGAALHHCGVPLHEQNQPGRIDCLLREFCGKSDAAFGGCGFFGGCAPPKRVILGSVRDLW